jgi:hypothetical protein
MPPSQITAAMTSGVGTRLLLVERVDSVLDPAGNQRGLMLITEEHMQVRASVTAALNKWSRTVRINGCGERSQNLLETCERASCLESSVCHCLRSEMPAPAALVPDRVGQLAWGHSSRSGTARPKPADLSTGRTLLEGFS